MGKPSKRMQRVADLVQEEMARILQSGASDPRFSAITITSVDISPNLARADIYITVLDESTIEATIRALLKANKFLRHQLACRVSLRVVPELHFYHDKAVLRGARLSALIQSASLSLPEDTTDSKEEESS